MKKISVLLILTILLMGCSKNSLKKEYQTLAKANNYMIHYSLVGINNEVLYRDNFIYRKDKKNNYHVMDLTDNYEIKKVDNIFYKLDKPKINLNKLRPDISDNLDIENLNKFIKVDKGYDEKKIYLVENVYSFLNKQKIIDKADVDINGFTYLKKNFVITKDDMNEFLEKTYLSELRVDQDVLASLYLSNEEIYKLDILLGSSLMDSDSLILSVSYSELNEASEITINHKF